MDKGVTIMPAEQVSAQAGRLVLLCKSERSGDSARREQKDERQNRSDTAGPSKR